MGLRKILWDFGDVYASSPHVVVRLLAVTALLYIACCIFTYFQLFGVSAIALSGQFALALFFTYAALTGYDDAETLLICLGMFLLVGMF